MGKKKVKVLPKCEFCGDEMDYRLSKKYCCDTCRNYAWREKSNKKERKERKVPLGYIKRRKDVVQFDDYLPFVMRFNKIYAKHLLENLSGEKECIFNDLWEMLKCDDPERYSEKIDEYLRALEY